MFIWWCLPGEQQARPKQTKQRKKTHTHKNKNQNTDECHFMSYILSSQCKHLNYQYSAFSDMFGENLIFPSQG